MNNLLFWFILSLEGEIKENNRFNWGMSWESTITYYQVLNETIKQKFWAAYIQQKYFI